MPKIFGKDKQKVRIEELRALPDERLFARFAEGEAEAFGVLLERYRAPIYGFICRQISDSHAGEELTQEVFLRAIARVEQFRGDSRFSTWLYQIARNLAFDHLRRMKVRRHESLDAPDRRGGSESPRVDRLRSRDPGALEALMRAELREQLESAIARLPDDQREVFLLRQVDGLAFGEIARVVDASENTVKSRMRYALLKLREELRQSHAADEGGRRESAHRDQEVRSPAQRDEETIVTKEAGESEPRQ